MAHFHLSNGARVERITPLGDTSEKGAKESATLMVNYLYDPGKIEDWHEDYAGEGKRNASTTVRTAGAGMEVKRTVSVVGRFNRRRDRC